MRHLRGLSACALLVLCTTSFSSRAAAQSCWAGDLFYSADTYQALSTEVERARFVRSEIAAMWGDVSPRVSNFANLYGAANFSDALARPGAEAVEEALALSAAQKSALLQGRTFNASRVDRVLNTMRQGGNYAARLGKALSFAGETIDAVNVFYNAVNAAQTGRREDKVATLQAAFSLARSRLAARWGGSIGPMMAMTGLLEYSINTYSQEAWTRYEDYWWVGYRNFTTSYWRLSADDWLTVYQSEGHEGVHARLMEFWDHGTEGVSGLAAMYQDEGVQRPFSVALASSGYALAEYQRAFAARYMIEIVEPQIQAAIQARADAALDEAMDKFNRECEASRAEAEAIDIAYILIEENRDRFETSACPAPQAFQRGISGKVGDDAANRKVRELRTQLSQLAAQEGFDYNAFEQAYASRLGSGLLTDVATEFSLRDLDVRPTSDFRPATIDLLVPPEVLTLVWSGKPDSFGAMLRSANIAFGKAIGSLGGDVLDDHFGAVNLITDYRDARSPLILHVTGFDFTYRNRAGIHVNWSGTGRMGVSACFEGQYLFEESFQSDETKKYAKGSDFSNGDALSVVASDVVRQTLDMAAARVKADSSARLQAYLAKEDASPAETVRFDVPEPAIDPALIITDDAAWQAVMDALPKARPVLQAPAMPTIQESLPAISDSGAQPAPPPGVPESPRESDPLLDGFLDTFLEAAEGSENAN